MSLSSTLLVLLSASMHVFWNSLVKASPFPVAFMGLKGAFLILVALLVVPLIGLTGVSPAAWPPIVLSGVFHAAYALALARAYEQGDISFVYPIARSAPALVPAFAFLLLGEALTPAGTLGVALVVLAMFMLQFRDGSVSPASVWRSLARSDGRWALTTLACVVAYSLVDKAGMNILARSERIAPQLRGPLYFLLENAIAYLLYLAILAGKLAEVRQVLRSAWRSALAGALLTMASYSLILHVMQSEPLSYIVAVRQSSVILAALYGWLWLREGHGASRVVLSAMMALGVAIITFSG